MNIARSSFYHWKKRIANPPEKTIALANNILLFKEYHLKYPSHGYRWLNAKIRLDKGIILSDPYAHKCCRIAGIKSKSKHYRYKRRGAPGRVYPNLMLGSLNNDKPMQLIASDMTALNINGVYYELTLYVDLWNNEILSYSISSKRGDRMTYISGLQDLTELKKDYPEYQTVLHSDRGSVYSSKSYNDILRAYDIVHSMSRAGTPTDNAAIESINGWIKAEIYTDFHLRGENIQKEIAEYIKFFNEERPAYTLGYLTPLSGTVK